MDVYPFTLHCAPTEGVAVGLTLVSSVQGVLLASFAAAARCDSFGFVLTFGAAGRGCPYALLGLYPGK